MIKRLLLAFDFGAESGRAFVGALEGARLTVEEIHRFSNQPVEICGTLYWNIADLYRNLLAGIREFSRRFGSMVDGIGIDTWGVDFGLLARDGSLLQNPVSYRDDRTRGMAEEVCRLIPSERVYQLTGITLLPIYTLCQLLSMRLKKSPILESAATLLMMPDLLAYFLTGIKRCERSNAVTTQLYDPSNGRWSDELFPIFNLPRSIMPQIVDSGTILGELCDRVKTQTGLKSAPVIAPCTHDTGSAVTGVPAVGDDYAFISSGTWSVFGMPTEKAVISGDSFAAGLCNELSLKGHFLCRNIMGLWILQGARAVWMQSGSHYSYAQLVHLAEGVTEEVPLIYPDDPAFLAPGDMTEAIRGFCVMTNQKPPEGPAEFSRCILESLALSHRQALDILSGVLGRRIRVLNLVGGGSLNSLLCRLTADATGVPVVAGPVEATVIGNLVAQAKARGFLTSQEEVDELLRQSSERVEYLPRDNARIEDRYAKYLEIQRLAKD